MTTISSSTTSSTAYKVAADTTVTLILQTGSGPTTAVTIDGSQNVTFAKGFTVGATAAPAFSAYYTGSGQAISPTTWTKLQINTEEFDTANCFDSTTNYRFTPTVAGYYQINANVEAASGVSLCPSIYKNGTEFNRGANLTGGGSTTVVTGSQVSALIYFNGSSDYVELYLYIVNSGNSTSPTGIYRNYFQGFLARNA